MHGEFHKYSHPVIVTVTRILQHYMNLRICFCPFQVQFFLQTTFYHDLKTSVVRVKERCSLDNTYFLRMTTCIRIYSNYISILIEKFESVFISSKKRSVITTYSPK